MISDFAKEKVFWTRKMNLKLVKFIESKPNIWNPKHSKYTSVEFRDQTYAEFASKYGNEFTGQAVKDRWTNIRSTFANYLRKLKASRTKEGGKEYKVTWHLWDACRFLLNINKKSKSIKPTSSHDKKEDDIKLQTAELCSEDDVSTHNGDDTTCENIANSILNVFQGVQHNVFTIDGTEYGQLGHMLANRLSQMNSLEAAQISNKIMDILLIYHEDNPYNPNNVKSEGY